MSSSKWLLMRVEFRISSWIQNGKPLLKEPFVVRRETLHKNLKEVDKSFVFAKFKDAEAIE